MVIAHVTAAVTVIGHSMKYIPFCCTYNSLTRVTPIRFVDRRPFAGAHDVTEGEGRMKSRDHWLPTGGAMIGMLLAFVLGAIARKLAGKGRVEKGQSGPPNEVDGSARLIRGSTIESVVNKTGPPSTVRSERHVGVLHEVELSAIDSSSGDLMNIKLQSMHNHIIEHQDQDAMSITVDHGYWPEEVIRQSITDYPPKGATGTGDDRDGRDVLPLPSGVGHGKRRFWLHRRRSPERRGGRPHREVTEVTRVKRKKRTIRPTDDTAYRLCCRLDGMEWIIGIEPMVEGLQFIQDDQPLRPADITESFYPLMSDRDVLISSQSGSKEPLQLSKKGLLLFRLDDGFEGTYVTDSGLRAHEHYVVIVRRDLVAQDKGLSRMAVALEGWVAYLMSTETAKLLCLTEKLTEPWPKLHCELNVELSGGRIEGIAPQYRAFLRPPQIHFHGAAEKARSVVIRLERAGYPWTRHFAVQGNPALIPEQIQEELLGIGAGRFAIRCYDAENRLLSSSDFRLIAGLRAVTRAQDNDSRIRVRFDVDPEYKLMPIGVSLGSDEGDPYTFIILPEHRQKLLALLDLVEWRVVASNGNGVVVGIDLERIFWAMSEDESAPTPELLGIRPVLFDSDDFRATSAKRLWLWLPRSLRKKQVMVGVTESGQQLAHRGRVAKQKRGDGLIEIALRDLEYLVPQSPGRYDWYIVFGDESRLVGHLERRLCCRSCGYVSYSAEDMKNHLRREHSWQTVEEIDVWETWLREGKSVPERVYVCAYCGKGFAEGGFENANTAVTAHQKMDCEEARKRAKDGPVLESIKILERGGHSDRDLIQALVEARWRCRLCGARLTAKDRYDHLWQAHLSEVTTLS